MPTLAQLIGTLFLRESKEKVIMEKKGFMSRISDQPFGSIPFNDILVSEIISILTDEIAQSREYLKRIKAEIEPDFDNVLLALEFCGEGVTVISSLFHNLYSADKTEDLQAIAEQFLSIESEYYDSIILDDELFQQVLRVYERYSQNNILTNIERRLLEKTYQSFTRNGALLNIEQKDRLKAINHELSQTKLLFQDNVMNSNKAKAVWVTDESVLQGIPEYAVARAKQQAESQNRSDAWLISLDGAMVMDVLTYAQNRSLRQEVYMAFNSVSYKAEQYGNEQVIEKILRLTYEKAQLLGYLNYADYILSDRMIGSREKVYDFLETLYLKSLPLAQEETRVLQEFALTKDGVDQLQRWDIAYYSELYKQVNLQFDQEYVKQFFPAPVVLERVLSIFGRLHQISFKSTTDVQTYHPDVVVYEVHDHNDEIIGLLYVDLYYRESKQQGAWMTDYRMYGKTGDTVQIPHISFVMNLTPVVEGSEQPSLMNLRDVETMFHELGHCMHGLLTQVPYPSLGGTNVKWDFVELPSQVMEHWLSEPEVLAMITHHWQTGAILPESYYPIIKELNRYMIGYATIRQISFARLDMAWYDRDQYTTLPSINEIEESTIHQAQLFPLIPHTAMSTSFLHIFAGGYSAGYYGYKYSEMLDNDVYEYLSAEGNIFNIEKMKRFRDSILAQGDSRPPMELYQELMGREPDPNALFRSMQLT